MSGPTSSTATGGLVSGASWAIVARQSAVDDAERGGSAFRVTRASHRPTAAMTVASSAPAASNVQRGALRAGGGDWRVERVSSEAVEPEALVAGELRLELGGRRHEIGIWRRNVATDRDAVAGEHVGQVGMRAFGGADRRHQQVAVTRGDPGAVLVQGDESAGGCVRSLVGDGGGVDDQDVVTEDPAHRADRVAQAVPEIERADGPRRLGRRPARVEERRRPVVAAEHPVLTRRLRGRGQVAGGDGAGDVGKRRERRLVAARVQRERRVVVVDRERLAGDDLAGVDVRGHEVPGHGVLALTGEQAPTS